MENYTSNPDGVFNPKDKSTGLQQVCDSNSKMYLQSAANENEAPEPQSDQTQRIWT